MTEDLHEVNKLLDKIRSGKDGRDQVITALFHDTKLRNGFKKMIRNQGWPKSVFDLIFTDAIIAFTSSVIRRKEFVLNSDLHNYLIVIGKRAYMRESEKSRKTNELSAEEEEKFGQNESIDLVINKEQKDLLQIVLERLGRNCREVLTYWASDYSMKEIAVKMNYRSDMMARKKKYKCFKELTDLVLENPRLENLLR